MYGSSIIICGNHRSKYSFRNYRVKWIARFFCGTGFDSLAPLVMILNSTPLCTKLYRQTLDHIDKDKFLEVQMDIPEYVSREEVRRICDQLGIRDWTSLTKLEVEFREAEIIRELVGSEALDVSVEEFQRGLEIELEHGIEFSDANVTNNHPVLTGKIVLAHLKETLDYYSRLEVAELEGDLLKAVISGDQGKLASKYQKLLEARFLLSKHENAQIKST